MCLCKIVNQDPAVIDVVGLLAAPITRQIPGRVYITLKPLSKRKISSIK